MTPEEQEVSDCLDKVFAYCRKHEKSCEGCIFFKSIHICDAVIVSCKVMYAPEIFGRERGEESDD